MFDFRRVTNKHTRFIIGSWGFTVDNQQNLLKTLLDDLDDLNFLQGLDQYSGDVIMKMGMQGGAPPVIN